MNVTKHGYRGRKLHKEDCPRMVVAEQREYVEVPAHVRIAETTTSSQTCQRTVC